MPIRNDDSIVRLERAPGYLMMLMYRTGGRPTTSHAVRPAALATPISSSELVYLEASPDFCDADERTGTPGTTGRRCNATRSALAGVSAAAAGERRMDGCDEMCCGRGFETRTRSEVEKCGCRFEWCCSVKCQLCQTTVVEHVCR